MSHRKSEQGFTLVELLVVIVVVAILFVTFSLFFNGNLILYTAYQKDGSSLSELAAQSTRMGNVLRGVTDIISASPNDLSAYAYFSPADTYVSIVHYYLNGAHTALMADVTQMTANPPNGTPISSSTRTYTIVSNYYQAPGSSLFTYYDAAGNILTPPIASEHTIIEIGVNLSAPASHSKTGQQLNLVVSLRNRKTNL